LSVCPFVRLSVCPGDRQGASSGAFEYAKMKLLNRSFKDDG